MEVCTFLACLIPIGVVGAAARTPLAADRPARGSAGDWLFPHLTGFRSSLFLFAQSSVEPSLDGVASPSDWDIDGESLFRSERRDEGLPGVRSLGGDSDFLVLEFDVDRTSVDHRKGSQDNDDRELHGGVGRVCLRTMGPYAGSSSEGL